MAKKTESSELDLEIEKEFAELQDMSTSVEIEPSYYIDTGNWALNYACSKNFKLGVPGSRITSFYGLSGVGKSMFLGQLIKSPEVEETYIISSEVGGLTPDTLKWLQVPTDKKIKYISLNTFTCYRINKETGSIEEIKDSELPKNKDTDKYLYKAGLTYFLKTLLYQLEYKRISKKILIIIDSMANVKSVRELSGTSDMGAKGKNINDLFSAISGSIEKTNATLVFSNKVYTNLNNPYDPFVQNGGLAVIYNPSLSIELKTVNSDDSNLSDAQIKEEKIRRTSSLGMAQKQIVARIKKSRSGTQDRNAYMLMDSTFGIIPSSGLFTLLLDFGVAVKNGSRYSIAGIPEFESFYKKDFVEIFLKDSNKFINTFQNKLNEREEEIAKQRMNMNYGDISDLLSDTENDYSADGIDLGEMAQKMELDVV